MSAKQALLSELHQARLESLKEMCLQNEISRNGPVEVIRARLITELVLDEWDNSFTVWLRKTWSQLFLA